MTLAISTAALEGSKKKKVSLPSVLNAGQFRRIKKLQASFVSYLKSWLLTSSHF